MKTYTYGISFPDIDEAKIDQYGRDAFEGFTSVTPLIDRHGEPLQWDTLSDEYKAGWCVAGCAVMLAHDATLEAFT